MSTLDGSPTEPPAVSTLDKLPATPSTGYEKTDIRVRGVWMLIGSIAVGLIVVQVGLWQFLRMLNANAQTHDTPMSPLAAQRGEPPAPRLQPHPQLDYRDQLDAQLTRLNSYGWSDQQAQMAHIPIKRAMDLFLERDQLIAPKSQPPPATAAPDTQQKAASDKPSR